MACLVKVHEQNYVTAAARNACNAVVARVLGALSVVQWTKSKMDDYQTAFSNHLKGAPVCHHHSKLQREHFM